jgi:ssDNA-binding Zn-finger/Zn-ribbon topoisomerase 1
LDEEKAMRLFEKCPICGGELVEKEVEKVLRGRSQYSHLEG